VLRSEKGVYEISVRSMNIDDRPGTNDQPRANNSHILGKFQMAITQQRINRSTSSLVLGWGFRKPWMDGWKAEWT